MNSYPVKKGEIVTLDVETLAFGGKGVARVEGYAVFVDRGLPGQKVEAMILRRKKGYAEARIERVLQPGTHEVEPRCRHFGVCGGCMLQHLAYPAQIENKRGHVRDCLQRLGGIDDVEVLPTLGADPPYEYRNKMEYSFSNSRWLETHELGEAVDHDRFGLGLHPRKRFDRVLNVERCHLQSPEGSQILGLVRDLAGRSGLPAYSTRTHQGFWRFLVIRESANTGERMVNIITHRARPGSVEARAVDTLAEALTARGPRITSLLHGTSESKSSVAFCQEVRVLAGDAVIRERLLDMTYEIGPNTFFQTNTRQAEHLFTEALERGGFGLDDTVWDLYCGAGALTLPLARRVRRVLGMELVEEAVEAGRRNAVANGVDNVSFLAGDLKALMTDGAPAGAGHPDGVVLDPPRDGVHPDVVATLIALAPKRMVYVSCNPATLARDLALFRQGGYGIDSVLPVDMFPHTAHVECVTSLTRG